MKIKTLLSLLIVFTLPKIMSSQTICENGFAGIYPCNGIDLLSHIPISTLANPIGNPEGSDIWGWTDPLTGKEYALVGLTNSTAFVDISDPINPIFLGRLNSSTFDSVWRDIKVYNDHAFIVSDNNGPHGMQVFDLTRLRSVANPPETFLADAVYTGVGSSHNVVINESQPYAYLVGSDFFSGGPAIIDISDPLNPFYIAGYSGDGYTHDAQVVTYAGPDTDYTGREIYIGSNETKVVILDVTDKNNIIKISEVTYPQIGYTHQGWLTDDHRYFLLGDETDEIDFGLNTRTIIFDFTNLDFPIQRSIYSGSTTSIDHNGYVLGNEFYLASYSSGMRIMDISNIQSTTDPMTEIAFFDSYPENDFLNFDGAWSIYPFFSSGNIVIGDTAGGLFVVRKSSLSVDENSIEAQFSLSPNPATNVAFVKSSQNQIIDNIEIYNNLGQKLFSKENINSDQFKLPISTYNSGMYIVRINNKLTKKLVIN